MKKNALQKNIQTRNIKVGNISDVSGVVNIAAGNIDIHEALTEALAKTRKRPKTARAKKSAIEKEVKGIEAEIDKKDVDRGFLAERFRNIAQMAPDILEVIIASLGNPAAALGVAVKKIAQKAKKESEKKREK